MAYNSKNTVILATHDKKHLNEVNKRMLLLHTCENGKQEYVIGSYFQQKPHIEMLGNTGIEVVTEGLTDYEWDWGHYFFDVVSAAEYWKKVLEGTDLNWD